MHTIYLAFTHNGIRRGSYLLNVPGMYGAEWVFRPEKVKLNHYYGNKNHQVTISKVGQYYIVTHYKKCVPVQQTSVPVNSDAFLIIRERSGIQRKGQMETINLNACLRNRFNEYKGLPLIPFSKGVSRYKERFHA